MRPPNRKHAAALTRATNAALAAKQKLKLKMINEKNDAVEYIVRVLEQKSDWRKSLAARFPDDPRNLRSSDRLDQLAVEAAEMTDEQFAALKPYFGGWASVAFRDALSQVSRQIGFQHRAKDFESFVKTLVHELSLSSRIAA
jgi:hypothetical protein